MKPTQFRTGRSFVTQMAPFALLLPQRSFSPTQLRLVLNAEDDATDAIFRDDEMQSGCATSAGCDTIPESFQKGSFDGTLANVVDQP